MVGRDGNTVEIAYSYEIKAYRAVDHPELCEAFEEGQRKILGSYGLTSLSTLEASWIRNPNVWMITANEVGDDEIVGGVRVHLFDPKWPLPLQDAMGPYVPSIDQYIDELAPKRIGELSGLWNSRSVYGRGLSPLLARSAVILSGLLKCDVFFTWCSHYTFDLALALGFVKEVLDDSDGLYPYPTDKFKTALTVIRDVKSVNCAAPEQRKRILDVREKPNQEVTELSQKKYLRIFYGLGVDAP